MCLIREAWPCITLIALIASWLLRLENGHLAEDRSFVLDTAFATFRRLGERANCEMGRYKARRRSIAVGGSARLFICLLILVYS